MISTNNITKLIEFQSQLQTQINELRLQVQSLVTSLQEIENRVSYNESLLTDLLDKISEDVTSFIANFGSELDLEQGLMDGFLGNDMNC